MNNREKYIKYKLKYLELQNLYGGDSNRKIKIGANKITKEERELADNVAKSKLLMEDIQTELSDIENSETVELKEKSKKYYRNLDELQNTLKTFMSELNCCDYDMEIQLSKNIPEVKKQFLSILKTNYAEMSEQMRNVNPTTQDISEITNYVLIENIYSHIKNNYEAIIKNIFNLYIKFLKKFTHDIITEKIPFYNLIPIVRTSNEILPEACKNSNQNAPVQDCYLVLLGAQSLTRIKLIFIDFFKIINDDTIYPQELINYIENIIKSISLKLELYNYIVGSMELHNYKTSYICTYDKKKYGEMRIYDTRTCQGKVKNSKECKEPCVYDRKNSTCNIKY